MKTNGNQIPTVVCCCHKNIVDKNWPTVFFRVDRAYFLAGLRWVLLLCTIWTAMLLQLGCANTSKIEHAVGYLNVGAVSIYDIEVTYGQAVIPFKGEKLSRRSGGWGVRMPIPDQMTVTWYTDRAAPPHRIAIAELRSRVSRSYELKNWELRFNADKLELWREEATGPRNPNTGLQPRQDIKVFP